MIPQQSIKIADYTYNLPDEKIAKFPLKERDKCKLLIYNNKTITEGIFSDVEELLEKDSLLVVNNTKVIPARLEFFNENGARIEIFCLEPFLPVDYENNFAAKNSCQWKCLAGNLKRWKNFNLKREFFYNNETIIFEAEKKEVLGGEVIVKFMWTGDYTFSDIIDIAGQIPIPPYLNRKAEESDNQDYQTVYSHFKGSVAAPTAGLHFTPQLLENLKCEKAELTLHVGAGTFKPVKAEEIGSHEMHREVFEVSKTTLEKILKFSSKITAVGTTSVRTLETLYWSGIKILKGENPETISQWECYEMEANEKPETAIRAIIDYIEKNGEEKFKAATSIMICPGYKYRIVKNIITNFHQPQSTLLLLVAAAVGENWKKIYDYALNNNFRFLSYGDSCFLQIEKLE
ncbi:MAG: S-adenosylmethionine:tRNA ribosyltransferase-isomerase [Bacteroidales bacterium]|nr:S-adenosylmethionine:tRNA ribosyltransferase-isomerase [Bacteroidales bacterium]